MTTKKAKKVEEVVAPVVEPVVDNTILAKAETAAKTEANQAVEVLEGLINTMNDLGLAIEPKIYMKLEDAKKRL